MVVGPSVCLEWQDHYDRQTLISDRIRCLNSRLGRILRRGTDWRPLVLRGETVAYQLPGSFPCSEMLCQRQEEHYCATQNRQHHSSRICEQAGWNSVQTEYHSQGIMALVHEQRYICLPFSLACAPWVFTKVLKSIAAQLRQLGMRLIVYIDNILILAGSSERAWEHVIGLMENLGFVISKPKCVLEPTQSIEFLGFSVNSVQQELSLPAGNVKKIRAETRHLLENNHISASSFWADCNR